MRLFINGYIGRIKGIATEDQSSEIEKGRIIPLEENMNTEMLEMDDHTPQKSARMNHAAWDIPLGASAEFTDEEVCGDRLEAQQSIEPQTEEGTDLPAASIPEGESPETIQQEDLPSESLPEEPALDAEEYEGGESNNSNPDGLEHDNDSERSMPDPLHDNWKCIDLMMPLLQSEITSLNLARANEDMRFLAEHIRHMDKTLEMIYDTCDSGLDKEVKREIESISHQLSELKKIVENRFERRTADYFIEVYDLISNRKQLLERGQDRCSEDERLEMRYCNLYLNKILELLAGVRVSHIRSNPGTPFDGHFHESVDQSFDPDNVEIEQSERDGFQIGNVVIRKEIVSLRRKTNDGIGI